MNNFEAAIMTLATLTLMLRVHVSVLYSDTFKIAPSVVIGIFLLAVSIRSPITPDDFDFGLLLGITYCSLCFLANFIKLLKHDGK